MSRTQTESDLLRSLRTREPELTALLEECSSHWGFEDPIYRFYHQSFKVFWLQNDTARIVLGHRPALKLLIVRLRTDPI